MNIVTFPSVPNNVDFAKSFVYQTSGGAAVDLTGSMLAMELRKQPGDVQIQITVALTITDALNGKFTISIPLALMNRLAANTYYHDLVRKRPDGTTEQAWSGTMTVVQGVTR